MWFKSGLKVSQSMTCISCCARNAVVSRAVWSVALSWTSRKFLPKTPVAQGCILEGFIQHHQFTPPTRVDRTPYQDWGATFTIHGLDVHIYQCPPHPHPTPQHPHPPTHPTPHHQHPHTPSCTPQTSTLACGAHDHGHETKQREARLSLRNQCPQGQRSHLLCILLFSWQRRLWSKVNQGHLMGRLDRKRATRSQVTGRLPSWWKQCTWLPFQSILALYYLD